MYRSGSNGIPWKEMCMYTPSCSFEFWLLRACFPWQSLEMNMPEDIQCWSRVRHLAGIRESIKNPFLQRFSSAKLQESIVDSHKIFKFIMQNYIVRIYEFLQTCTGRISMDSRTQSQISQPCGGLLFRLHFYCNQVLTEKKKKASWKIGTWLSCLWNRKACLASFCTLLGYLFLNRRTNVVLSLVTCQIIFFKKGYSQVDLLQHARGCWFLYLFSSLSTS